MLHIIVLYLILVACFSYVFEHIFGMFFAQHCALNKSQYLPTQHRCHLYFCEWWGSESSGVRLVLVILNALKNQDSSDSEQSTRDDGQWNAGSADRSQDKELGMPRDRAQQRSVKEVQVCNSCWALSAKRCLVNSGELNTILLNCLSLCCWPWKSGV